jgi:glutathione S-transferase
MITLYGSGPNFGLPDASPFVTKAETLLRMSKLPFEKALMSFSKAPKGKIPYIEDDGQLLGDSTLIRWHLEKKYGIDFDQGLTAEQLAIAWAFEKMAEDNLYWASVYFRWMIDANFRKGPVNFFKGVPAPVRPVVVSMIRRRLRKTLQAGNRPSLRRRDHRDRNSLDRCDGGLSRRQAVLHGQRADRHRCHHVRLRGQCDLSAVRVGVATGGLKPCQSAALCRPHGRALLSRTQRDRGLQSRGLNSTREARTTLSARPRPA